MPRVFARLLVALGAWSAALAVFLVASPAWASAGMSAPQCDVRGAITFAPPPQLQPLQQSIDAIDDELSCVEKMLAGDGLRQGNAPPPSPVATEPVAPPPLPALPSFAPVVVRADLATLSRAPEGVRASVERPPRA